MTPGLIDFLIVLSLILFDILAIIFIVGLIGVFSGIAKIVESSTETMHKAGNTLDRLSELINSVGKRSVGIAGITGAIFPMINMFMKRRKQQQPKHKLIDLALKYLI